MIPFRVFDREAKVTWLVINYHQNASTSGEYLVAREDDSDQDGELKVIPADELTKFRMIDFLDEEQM
jgi:hypothetical protein